MLERWTYRKVLQAKHFGGAPASVYAGESARWIQRYKLFQVFCTKVETRFDSAWFSLAAIKENHSETDLVSSLVSIYDSARTYFSTNAD